MKMKSLCRFLALTFLGLALPAGPLLAATTPAGHWQGAITLPGTELAIRVDLEKAGAEWLGTIDIPVQGLRGFKLGGLEVAGERVAFTMPNIPGDPKFDGKLTTDVSLITGIFSQAGQTYPFKLERRAAAPAAAGETPGKGVPGKGLAGYWQGSLKPSPIMELRLVLEITNPPAGEPAGVMISVDQGSSRIQLSAATEQSGLVRLEIRSIGASFDGTLSADGSEISGDWNQGGNKLPLVFKRLEKAPDFGRSQDPKKPYPYDEEEVAFENPAGNFKLAGTLTLPRGAGPHPAVALISGSGPQDRDEAIMGHRPFLVLADHLTRNGIAVLRYDDRGAGKSGGNFSNATTDDFTTDALAAIRYLKSRKEVNAKRLGLIGHSEGGIVAPQAAVLSDDVSFIVLLAGVGVPMDELLARQAEDILRVLGGSEEMASKQAMVQKQLFAAVRKYDGSPVAGEKVRGIMEQTLKEFTPEQLEASGWNQAQADGQLQMVLSPWFRALLDIDPRLTLAKVKCPVLAINGGKDVQVASKVNLAAIESALKQGGNSRVTIKEFPGLNHLFQKCTTGAIAEYSTIDETIYPEVLATVSGWIRQQTGLD